MVELLKQGQYVPVSIADQVMIVWAGTKGHLDDVPTVDIARFQDEFLAFCDKNFPDIEVTLNSEQKISDETDQKLISAVTKFKEQFTATEA